MKKILLIYQDEVNGNSVLGHKRRCESMGRLLKRGGNSVKIVPYHVTRYHDYYKERVIQDFTIFDGVDYLPSEHVSFNKIHVFDDPDFMYPIGENDFVLAPGYGAEKVREFKELENKKLLGLDAFPRHPHIDIYRKRIGYNDGKYILLAPGGNKESFWDTVGSFNVSGEIVCILKGVSHEQSLALIAGAKFVITAAGVTSVESVLLGKPTLLVKTSEDQANYDFMIDDGVAFPYTYGMARILSDDVTIRNRMSRWNLEETKKVFSSSFYSNFMGMIGV